MTVGGRKKTRSLGCTTLSTVSGLKLNTKDQVLLEQGPTKPWVRGRRKGDLSGVEKSVRKQR